jgi:uncharacterized delta-60 repeat protein
MRGIGAGLVLAILVAGVALAKPGDLDRSFSGDGKLTTDLGSTESTGDQANAVLVMADGRILAAGRTGIGTAADSALVRYTRSGGLDRSLGDDGIATEDVSGDAEFDSTTDAVVEPGGKIVVVGQSGAGATSDFGVARFGSNGALDTTFNQAGTTPGTNRVGFPFSADDAARALVREPDGEIVASGDSDDTSEDFAFVRFTTAGATDNGQFGATGRRNIVINGTDESAADVAVLSGGKLLAAGYSYDPADLDPADFALVRLNEDGSLDGSFNPGGPGPGIGITDFGGGTDLGFAMAVQPDGKILVGGARFVTITPTVRSDFVLARYNASGTLDTTFGGGDGFVTTNIPGHLRDSVSEIVLQPDGRIVATGPSFDNVGVFAGDFALARYLPNGAPDTSFSGNGIATTSFAGDDIIDQASAVAIEPESGRIVVAGSGATDFALARYQGAPNCGGRPPTLAAFGKKTKGTPKRDVIVGGAGRQTILGRGGKDVLCGGSGRDRLIGGKGRDRLIGGAGRDFCLGGPGRDRRRSCERGR